MSILKCEEEKGQKFMITVMDSKIKEGILSQWRDIGEDAEQGFSTEVILRAPPKKKIFGNVWKRPF